MGFQTELVLTDDEMLAIAHDAGATPVASTPTVDLTDADAIRAAVFRGQRSLHVRRLIDASGVPSEPVAQVGLLLTPSRNRVSLFLGDASMRRAAPGVGVNWFSTADGWIRHDPSPLGTHRFTSELRDDDAIGREIGEALTGGPARPDEASGARVCVAFVTSEGATTVAVRDDRIEVSERNLDGQVVSAQERSNGALSATILDQLSRLSEA